MGRVTLITMKHPCSACQIAASLMEGLFERLRGSEECVGVEWEIVVLEHPREFGDVPGLEVERLPAVIVDGEQVSAGNILHKRQLLGYINSLT